MGRVFALIINNTGIGNGLLGSYWCKWSEEHSGKSRETGARLIKKDYLKNSFHDRHRSITVFKHNDQLAIFMRDSCVTLIHGRWHQWCQTYASFSHLRFCSIPTIVIADELFALFFRWWRVMTEIFTQKPETRSPVATQIDQTPEKGKIFIKLSMSLSI